MTSIQIASDLHIEFKNDDVPDPLNYITPTANILILAGDIGSLYKTGCFISTRRKQYFGDNFVGGW